MEVMKSDNTYEKRVRVWCFIKEHGLDEEAQALTEERTSE